MTGTDRPAARGGHVAIGGVRLWYEESGDPAGPPVLLLMGVDASLVWWPPQLIDGLAGAGCRVIRFDSRDIGLSTHIDHDAAPYTVDDMAADAVALLEALGVERAHWVGCSVGGVLAQMVALRRPERVLSLALVSSTPGPDDRLSPPTGALQAFFDRPAEPGQSWADATLEFCRALAGSRFPFDEPYHRALIAADLARGTNRHSHHGHLPFPPSRVDALRGVRVPTLVVHGTEDPLFPFDHARTMADAIPGATLHAWAGVGHEQPPPLMPDLSRRLIEHLPR